MTVEFNLNGRPVAAQADPAERLSDFLHDRFGMLSVRRGCGSGRCGSCLVLMDGKAVPACLMPSKVGRAYVRVCIQAWKFVQPQLASVLGSLFALRPPLSSPPAAQ